MASTKAPFKSKDSSLRRTVVSVMSQIARRVKRTGIEQLLAVLSENLRVFPGVECLCPGICLGSIGSIEESV
ncbi:hypothetical protein ANCDUO_13490 [Ancylostoma duodenale]|uniref:Uncharacterized protein n=1 Tax=Ancylostoma duodenale TaxID=51022 RepID=A0A0C2G5R0_9BILA|nr:hypothetical protein ANCDUO_13490 [Ancylostoma duodenale]